MSRKVLVPLVYSWRVYTLRYDEQEGSSSWITPGVYIPWDRMSRKVLVPLVYSWRIYTLRCDEQEGSSSSGLLLVYIYLEIGWAGKFLFLWFTPGEYIPYDMMSRKVLVPLVYSWSICTLRYDEQEGSSSSGLLLMYIYLEKWWAGRF